MSSGERERLFERCLRGRCGQLVCGHIVGRVGGPQLRNETVACRGESKRDEARRGGVRVGAEIRK
jgi:hypothetical protein